MTLPNFLIIGVQKAGTTSIYNYLKQHPQVYVSPVKETNFLEKNWENESRKPAIDTLEKYEKLFAQVSNELAIGEASPNYLFHYDSSIERIQRYVPQAKLIAILRNPIDRAYSDYLMHIRDAIRKSKPKSLAELITDYSASSFILLKGFYYQHLQHFYQAFEREQIQVYLYDNLVKDSVKFMQNLYHFLEVDDTFSPDVSRRSQLAQVPKNQTFNKLLRQENSFRTLARSALKLVLPVEARQKIRSSLINLNSQDKTAVPLTPENRQQLQELYREDILKLQDLIDEDLTAWLDS
ncbi:MAG: sulfotransferase [Jaaginema sp. PMC 1079.18]|nr:sulfotransferase [Jaaginema sp. PMC 1080.18]MEC4851185.1 sulfotransferase [Jaaginema sp. PMC 1079.18]MEC4865001.1 sulfotransferase [Jaaginema sp. PMC 1078.18]